MKALAALPIVTLAACAASLAPPNLTGNATAGFGQTAIAGPVLVTPIALVEDSRCPATVQCVWAGQLVVKAEIRAGSAKQVRNLALGTPQQVVGGEITLVDGMPARVAGQPTKPADYRFTFSFSAKP